MSDATIPRVSHLVEGLRTSAGRSLSRLPPRTPAVLALLTAAVIFGSAAVPAKTALKSVPPFILAEIRWLIALSVLLVLLRRSGERPVFNRYTWVLGLTGLALFYLFYSYGLRNTTAANATLIAGGTPVIVALLSAMFLGEYITRRKALGIVASLLGVGVIVSVGAGFDASILGNVLVVGSALSWAIYTVVGRSVLPTGSSLALLVGTAIAGLIIMLPFALAEAATNDLNKISGSDLLLILYLGLGPSLTAYMLWSYGLSRLQASQAAVYGNIMPLAGAAAGYFFLGESLGWPHLIGGACIILGVWLATKSARSGLQVHSKGATSHGAIE